MYKGATRTADDSGCTSSSAECVAFSGTGAMYLCVVGRKGTATHRVRKWHFSTRDSKERFRRALAQDVVDKAGRSRITYVALSSGQDDAGFVAFSDGSHVASDTLDPGFLDAVRRYQFKCC